MNTKILLFLFLVLSVVMSNGQGRRNYLLDKDWKFLKGDHQMAVDPSYDDASWENVNVPHDWAIAGPFDRKNDLQEVIVVQNGEKEATWKEGRTGGLPFIGVGWYRKKLDLPPLKDGQKVNLLFDGAMSNAEVFVNGKKAGEWPYGYNSFHLDITPFLNNGGKNVLAVRLENLEQASRWYSGAGLYRHVHLTITDSIHIPVWGTYVTTPKIGEEKATVRLLTKIEGNLEDVRLATDILDAKGKKVASLTSAEKQADTQDFEQYVEISSPSLWSPETPVLYTARTKVFKGKVLKDTYETVFGIRDIRFEKERGFLLNGKARKFKGVCNHHDLGPLGAAVNMAALRRQLTLLKDMGADAIRTSHNMPAPELVQLCDEMGFMLIVEAFDEWKAPKMKNGYHRLFDQWAEKDLINMVHRDRNHPSVILWSIGNEVPDQNSKDGNVLAKWLQDICHREDPSRLVTVGMDRFDAVVNNGFAAIVDMPGFNYKPSRYAEAFSKLPQKLMYGSETASTVSSRGVYKFPVAEHSDKLYEDNQSSSYDLEHCAWSQTPDAEFVVQDSLNYVLGEFVWTGFDYLGEPSPYDSKWPSHSSYFGIIDLAGIPKDRYYLYRSRWNEQEETLHLLPHWTWPGREGETTPVFCYTSYPEAELFVNGKSMGRQRKNNASPQHRNRLMWPDVLYESGSIKVVAYDEKGHEVANKEIKTAGKAHHIVLEADKPALKADGADLLFVRAKIVDEQGNLCPVADNELSFEVEGAATFKAVANGDPTSLQSFIEPKMKVFNGELVAIVQSNGKKGKLVLKAKGEGIQGAAISISAN